MARFGRRQPGNPATRQPGNPATRQPGNPATQTIISNNHTLQALAALPLIAAVVLIIAAFIFFWPVTATGSLVLAGTGTAGFGLSISGGFVGLTAASITALYASNQASNYAQKQANDHDTAHAGSAPSPGTDSGWTVGGPRPETPLHPKSKK